MSDSLCYVLYMHYYSKSLQTNDTATIIIHNYYFHFRIKEHQV